MLKRENYTSEYMHVYKEDLVKYKDDIIWLPEDPAELLSC